MLALVFISIFVFTLAIPPGAQELGVTHRDRLVAAGITAVVVTTVMGFIWY